MGIGPAAVTAGDEGARPVGLGGPVVKTFACGDVVPGCEASWVCDTEDDILANVAAHAAADHGLVAVSDELVAAVRAHIVAVA